MLQEFVLQGTHKMKKLRESLRLNMLQEFVFVLQGAILLIFSSINIQKGKVVKCTNGISVLYRSALKNASSD